MKRWLIACCATVLAAASFAAPAVERKIKKAHPKKIERLACMLGTEDRQARIAVEVVNGLVRSFAYYSKWKPRTCSISVERNDAYSKWQDTGHLTTVRTDQGSFLIENRRRDVHFIFRDVDRAFYCGMEPGTISGSLTVSRGRPACKLQGLMDADKDQ